MLSVKSLSSSLRIILAKEIITHSERNEKGMDGSTYQLKYEKFTF